MNDTAGKETTMNLPRNPARLLGLGSDPALSRLLRACGTDEACISGGASDYDKFLALAAALPLCEGHPLRDDVNATLTAATGLSSPLCPHTARAHWEAWVQAYWYGSVNDTPILPTECSLCLPAKNTVWRTESITPLPDPLKVRSEDLRAWSAELETALPPCGIASVILPENYVFVRPDPYHAALAVGKTAQGELLTDSEGHLLVTQALRVWGLASVRLGTTLLLRGGTPSAVRFLLAYMDTSRALPEVVWIPKDPIHAGEISGLYPTVRTGMIASASPSHRRDYAAVAPVGACVSVEEEAH